MKIVKVSGSNISQPKLKTKAKGGSINYFNAQQNQISFKGSRLSNVKDLLLSLVGKKSTAPKVANIDVDKVVRDALVKGERKLTKMGIQDRFRDLQNEMAVYVTKHSRNFRMATQEYAAVPAKQSKAALKAKEAVVGARKNLIKSEKKMAGCAEKTLKQISDAKNNLDDVKPVIIERIQKENPEIPVEKIKTALNSLFFEPSELDGMNTIAKSNQDLFNEFLSETKKLDNPEIQQEELLSAFENIRNPYQKVRDNYTEFLVKFRSHKNL